MRSGQWGFSLLGLLFLVAGLGVALAAVGGMWHTAAQREKETELLFIGDQYRQAIADFHEKAPAGAIRYPKTLQELVQDPRYPMPVHHLRRLYRDPMTGSASWGLVKDGEGIVGVYSLSEEAPLKRAGFPVLYKDFENADSYQDWVFMAEADDLPAEKGAAGQRRGGM